MSKTPRYLILAVLLVASMSFLAACGSNNDESKTTEPSPTQTAEATAEATSEATVEPISVAPDWTTQGFATVAASESFTPGSALTITSDPYTLEIPGDALDVPATFQLLTGELTDFQDEVPAGETPAFAFALKVTNANTDDLIGTFTNPIMLTVNSPSIVADSMYYNITPDGKVEANPTGMKVVDGMLQHPIAGTMAGWVITSPSGTSMATEEATAEMTPEATEPMMEATAAMTPEATEMAPQASATPTGG